MASTAAGTPTKTSAQTTAKIKRKPPPSFPYSPRYPPPDPNDPFVPLAVLRSRAHSSSTALDSPELQSTRPSTSDSRASNYLLSDTPELRHSSTLTRSPEPDAQRPWYGLAKGYLSDAAKPLRPPRSRKRQSTGRDASAYFSDADVFHERRLTIQAQTTPKNAVEPLATPKTKRASVHRRDSQYHYRRRSQSVNALSQSKPGSRESLPPPPPPRANASESTQYAYDVRQSHGYVFGEVDRLGYIEYEEMPRSGGHGHTREASTPGHSQSSTDTSLHSAASRHPTPPMTPDDTISSFSMTSPPTGRDVSLSPPPHLKDLPPLHESKPLPVPSVEHAPAATNHSARTTIVGDTPVNEFSILRPPPSQHESSTPPSTDEEGLGPLASTVSRLPGRSVESDTEVTVVDSLRRRSRTTSLSEMRRRLRRPPVVTSGARAKGVSSPSPISPDDLLPSQKRLDKTLSAIMDTSSMSTTSTPVEPTLDEPPPSPPAVPKPKKSLSHVDLGLKPLPNMSLAPTIAPSANTSITSVSGYGGLTLTRPRDDLLRTQTAPVPALPDRIPNPRRTQTDGPHIIKQPVMSRKSSSSAAAHPEYTSSEEEDLATHSMYTNFTRVLSPVTPLLPSPMIDPPPRVTSPIPIPRSNKPEPHRRGSDQSTTHRTPPTKRSESPTPRVAVPAPKAVSARAEVPACYRNPEPLPLSPPPRAKSPMAEHFQMQGPPLEELPAPAHTRSPGLSQSLSRAKGVQDVRKREDDERSSQRSRSRSVDDGGYLPVAQLHPTMSRQATTRSRSSSVRPGTSRGPSASTVRAQAGPARRNDDDDDDDDESDSPRDVAKSPARALPQGAVHSAVPARVRGPDALPRPVRTLSKPMKDLDSPLPPPPKEFLVRASAAAGPPADRSRTPPPPRAMTSPEPRSPPPSAQLGPQGGARQRMSSAPAPARGAQEHADAFVHGRGCSPNASRGLGFASASPGEALPDFDVDRLPTREQLARAAGLVVVAQNGVRVPFGELFSERKTVVVFIRHFWCPLCQDYMYSVSRHVDPDVMRRANVDLVVIGNGSPAMIRAYKQIFRMPFQLYTDPSHKVYSALGMTLRTTDPGPENERGRYVRRGVVGGIAMVVRNALRVGMPVWEKGGDHAQLGGEFVLGPGLTCSYAHRMKNTRSHAPILDVVAAAGVQMYAPRPRHRGSDDDTWERGKDTERSRGGRHEKSPRDCDDTDYCGTDDDRRDRRRRAPASSRRHVREVVSEPSSTEDEREQLEERRKAVIARARAKEQSRRGPRSYRIANPDRPRAATRSGSTDKYEAAWRPAAKAPQLGALERDDDAYMLTHEVLSYSFGNT